MEQKYISIFLKTKKEINNEFWLKWYQDTKKIVELVGYKITHLGIDSENFDSGKIRTFIKNENKIINEIKNENKINSISVISLPEDYKTAAFDYDITIGMDKINIIASMKKEIFLNNEVNEKKLIDYISKYGEKGTGEIFEMGGEEFPLGYAAGFNEESFYKTLKIIKKI